MQDDEKIYTKAEYKARMKVFIDESTERLKKDLRARCKENKHFFV